MNVNTLAERQIKLAVGVSTWCGLRWGSSALCYPSNNPQCGQGYSNIVKLIQWIIHTSGKWILIVKMQL